MVRLSIVVNCDGTALPAASVTVQVPPLETGMRSTSVRDRAKGFQAATEKDSVPVVAAQIDLGRQAGRQVGRWVG